MGTEALYTYYDLSTPYLRTFAMCSKQRGGAVVLVIINNSNTTTYAVAISGIRNMSKMSQ